MVGGRRIGLLVSRTGVFKIQYTIVINNNNKLYETNVWF